MSDTIGIATSRVRNIVKAVKTDAFITDRFLYSLILKYARAFVRRQDSLNQIVKYQQLFRTLPCVELITSNKVEACCEPKSDCLIKRTKERIPDVMESTFGPIFNFVSSIDGSIQLYPTTPNTYTSMSRTTSFKFNKNKYYWQLNGYLFFPDLKWDTVKIQAVFEGDLNGFTCEKPCIQMQHQQSPIPEFLYAEIEQQVLRDLGITAQLPEDYISDKISPLR